MKFLVIKNSYPQQLLIQRLAALGYGKRTSNVFIYENFCKGTTKSTNIMKFPQKKQKCRKEIGEKHSYSKKKSASLTTNAFYHPNTLNLGYQMAIYLNTY